jgi:hypothetical protein
VCVLQANVPPRKREPTKLQQHKAWLKSLRKNKKEMQEATLLGTMEKEERRLKVGGAPAASLRRAAVGGCLCL